MTLLARRLPLRETRRFYEKQMAYSERRIVGWVTVAPYFVIRGYCILDPAIVTLSRYSREQMFDVVAHVEKYSEFVPWCRGSRVHHEGEHSMLADLEVGIGYLRTSEEKIS